MVRTEEYLKITLNLVNTSINSLLAYKCSYNYAQYVATI